MHAPQKEAAREGACFKPKHVVPLKERPAWCRARCGGPGFLIKVPRRPEFESMGKSPGVVLGNAPFEDLALKALLGLLLLPLSSQGRAGIGDGVTTLG